jgi:cobalamin-dependent methionine synthase I
VILDLPATVPVREVHRLLGYPAGHAIPARVAARLDRLLAQAISLIASRGVWKRFPLAESDAVALTLPGPADALGGFALGLATIGPGVEKLIDSATQDGEMTDALLLDAIGSAAAEAAADALGIAIAKPACKEIVSSSELTAEGRLEPASSRNRPAASAAESASPCRVSPGYGGWPLTVQTAIFARLPHDALGVRLLPSMLMVPKKSVTFAIWFDPEGRAVAGLGGCSRCALERCPRRVAR